MDSHTLQKTFETESFGSFGGLHNPEISPHLAEILIVGIPYEGGTTGQKGTSFAPVKLRDFSRDLQIITRRGQSIAEVKLKDMGNVPIFPLSDNMNDQSIFSTMKTLFSQTTAPVITIGGDHSITYPEVRALAEKEAIGIIWIDAHRDLLDSMNGSKYAHGCSLRRIIESGAISPENVILIGTRYMEQEETTFLQKHKLKEISMPFIEDMEDPREFIKKTIAELKTRVSAIFLSIDIDGFDPSYAPGTGTPVAGGLSTNLVFNIIHDLPLPIRAADIVEVSPPLDSPASITTKLQMGLITELIGKMVMK